MKLRITSNGIGQGSRVENAATGETIDGIEHVDISIPATGLVTATIRVIDVAMDVTALLTPLPPQAQQEPCCRKRPLTPEDIEIINSTFTAALNVHSRPNRPPLPG